jgi:hypothetical protein
MRNIVIRTSYEVLLWHFVDTLSLWNVFVGRHMYVYFDEEFGINDEDLKRIQHYKEIRSKFGWYAESELFEWAYNKYPNEIDFDKLVEDLKYFENRISKSGVSLKDILIGRLGEIQDFENKGLKFEKNFLEVDRIVSKINDFHEIEVSSQNLNRPIYAYLACSMSLNRQGGANGEDIYSEVSKSSDFEFLNKTVSTFLLHEYFHKVVDSMNALIKLNNQFNYLNENIYPDTMASFFKEVIAHCAINVYMFKENPKLVLESFSESQRNTKYYYLWESILLFEPMFSKYLDNKISTEVLKKKFILLSKKVIQGFKGKEAL